jgi:hypothetical protein
MKMEQTERGKRGKKFSLYIGDKSVEEQAFWDLAEEYRRPRNPERYEWSELFKEICKMIKDNQDNQSQNISPAKSTEFEELKREFLNLSLKVKELEKNIKVNQAQSTPASNPQQETEENELAKIADRLASEDW